jgi:hypothetical protein
MRGSTDPQLAMLTSLSTEELIPAEHPIRRIRVVVDAVVAEMGRSNESPPRLRRHPFRTSLRARSDACRWATLYSFTARCRQHGCAPVAVSCGRPRERSEPSEDDRQFQRMEDCWNG